MSTEDGSTHHVTRTMTCGCGDTRRSAEQESSYRKKGMVPHFWTSLRPGRGECRAGNMPKTRTYNRVSAPSPSKSPAGRVVRLFQEISLVDTDRSRNTVERNRSGIASIARVEYISHEPSLTAKRRFPLTIHTHTYEQF